MFVMLRFILYVQRNLSNMYSFKTKRFLVKLRTWRMLFWKAFVIPLHIEVLVALGITLFFEMLKEGLEILF